MLMLNKYKSDTSGNVAMMFAVCSLMLMTGVAVAIDYSNITLQKTELQAQVDAAVLAAVTIEVEGNNSADDRKLREAAAKQVLAANGYDTSEDDYNLKYKQSSIELKASRNYKPMFAGILGLKEMKLEAIAESGLPNETAVDVVLVLDNTESMSVDGKMDALKEGATKLVEAIEASGTGTKIGLVPFARYVRVDKKYKNASWFEMPAEFDHSRNYKKNVRTGGTCTTVPNTYTVDGVKKDGTKTECVDATYEQEDATKEYKARWDGCLGTRSFPHSEKDDSYSVKIPGLLNVVPRGTPKGTTYDKYAWCPREITPVTDKYNKLKNDIKGMWTTDNTYMPTGLIWGQRVLSPGEPFDNTPKKGDTVHKQFMVLMTDGHNTTEIKTDSNSVLYKNSPPYIADISSDEEALEANIVTERMCDNIKAEGVKIYTIAFQVTDTNTQSLLRKCASENSMALTADNNAALIARFESLAKTLKAEIRLMQ